MNICNKKRVKSGSTYPFDKSGSKRAPLLNPAKKTTIQRSPTARLKVILIPYCLNEDNAESAIVLAFSSFARAI